MSIYAHLVISLAVLGIQVLEYILPPEKEKQSIYTIIENQTYQQDSLKEIADTTI